MLRIFGLAMAENARPRTRRTAFQAGGLAFLVGVCLITSSETLRASAATLQGIDVSQYQGSINWGQVAASGISFAYIRAGDGSGYVDPKFQNNWNCARGANVARGAYLYYEPADDPAAQANLLLHQLQMVGFLQGDLVPAIDVETMGGQTASTVAANLHTTVNIVANALGALPAIYASPSWWDGNVGSSAFTSDPLWIANWCGSCASPSMPANNWGGHGWSVWQDSSSGSVAGISGAVDTDVAPGPAPFPFYEPFRPFVGALGANTTPDGTQLLFWHDPANYHLVEGWFAGGNWNGPADLTAGQFNGAGLIYSAPAVASTPDDAQELLFWQGAADHLFEAWFTGKWNGPLDLTASQFGGAAPLANAPTATVTTDGSTELVFWRGVDSHLYEAWYAAGHWNGPVDWSSGPLAGAQLGSAPSVAVTPDGSTQLVFWSAPSGDLQEAWWAGGRWNGPADWSSGPLSGARLGSAPSVAVTPDGSSQLVFWRTPNGDLQEAWWAGARWNGPTDWTAGPFGGIGPLTSAPAVAVTRDNLQQLVFWQGPNANLWEAWWACGRWNGPVDFTLGG